MEAKTETKMETEIKNLHFTPYATRHIKPTGWLRRQLQIQAQGLSGHLDKVWPDVKDSQWIGGDKEGWERVPYWLDGFIPLAYLLDDQDMQTRAKVYIDAILSRQEEDGWICPCPPQDRGRYDMWAHFLICKVLTVYHDCTHDPRIEEALYKALKKLDTHIESFTLFNWAATRWYECLIPLFWLYARRPQAWMLDLAHKLEEQGTDYEKTFTHWRYQQPQAYGRWSFMTHVVNLAMMLKSRALFSRITGEDPGDFAKKALDILLRDHGMAVEHFTGDECLAGTSPIQGTELCSVAEIMYSYQWLMAITGDPAWGDKLEKAAFNALPATISPDMWTHQYDQMTNQISCTVMEAHRPFRTNGPEANLFGLEPNYGCCTANFNQAWPKFALSTMMQVGGDGRMDAAEGVAITTIAPSKLNTTIKGVPVSVEVITNYPFEDGYRVQVKAASPVVFSLYLRIPASAQSATVNGMPASSGFYTLQTRWRPSETVVVNMAFAPTLTPRPSGLFALWRGPLLYALPIQEKWKKKEYTRDGVERKFPYCDYEITPQSKWNYGFAEHQFTFNGLPPGGKMLALDSQDDGQGEGPFNPHTPPVSITATLAQVPWESNQGVCAPTPLSHTAIASPEEIKLIPYGCTNLRMTEMPSLV